MVYLLTLLACQQADTCGLTEEDVSLPSGLERTEGRGCGSGADVIVATTDYQVGALALVGEEVDRISDRLVPAGGDPQVVVQDCDTWLLERSSTDAIRHYASGGDLSTPSWEIALDPGANAHDVALWSGELYVTQYGKSELSVRDPSTGLETRAIDLSGEADDDGIPEMSSMAIWDGRLFVALQRLDRNADWVSRGGRIVEIGPQGVIGRWDVGPSPEIEEDAGGLLLKTGLWFEIDGQVSIWTPDNETILVTEEDAGGDIASVVHQNGLIAFVVAEEVRHGLACGTVRDWSVREWTNDTLWELHLGQDTVWIARRKGWVNPESAGYLDAWTLTTCEPKLPECGIALSMEPYSVASW